MNSLEDRVREQLGQYRLVRLIGQGGFAEVYLGQHLHLPRTAAIKALHAPLTLEQAERFLREAHTLATLDHPHIVSLLDFAVEGDTPYLVMEYASRGSLRAIYPPGSRLDLGTILQYVRQIADALQYAHDHSIIHRDIKPENILADEEGKILLSDFGIAIIDKVSSMSGLRFTGTPLYMAPEQVVGRPSFASDQYALGIVVYEWLCGFPPFSGAGMGAMLQHVNASIQPLTEHLPTLDPRIERVVMRALEKVPENRFPTVHAFAIALEEAIQQASPESLLSGKNAPGAINGSSLSFVTQEALWVSSPISPLASSRKPILRRGRMLFILSGILTLLILMGLLFSQSIFPLSPAPPQQEVSQHFTLPTHLTWDFVLYHQQVSTGRDGVSYQVTTYDDLATHRTTTETIIRGTLDVIAESDGQRVLGFDVLHHVFQEAAGEWLSDESLFNLAQLRRDLETSRAVSLGKLTFQRREVIGIRDRGFILLLDKKYNVVNVLNLQSKPLYTQLQFLDPSRIPDSVWDMSVPNGFRTGVLPKLP